MLLSLSSLFSACNKSEAGEGDAETTTVASTAQPIVNFLVSDLSKACIIYPSDASAAVQSAAQTLSKSIKEKFGVELKVRSDYVNADFEEFAELEYEILVGRCANREESESFVAKIRVDDMGYSLIGKKIVICGGSDEKLSAVIAHFTDKVIKTSDGKSESVFFSPSMNYIEEGTYNVDSVKLSGAIISEYVIVYPALSTKAEMLYAQKLADSIEEISGYHLRIRRDETLLTKSAKEIRLGATDRNAGIIADLGLSEAQYSISVADDGALLVVGKDGNALYGATEKIIDMIKNGGKEVELDFSSPVKEISASREFTIMTYNVLCDQLGSGTTRYDNVMSDVLSRMPDSVGFQEVTGSDHSGNWMQHLKDGLGQYYDCVGAQRGDGQSGGVEKASRGEYSCIFYRKDLYTLKDSGTKWLSDTPDVISKYSESGYNRVMTWAKLERKSDGKVFVHVNTHLAHESDDIAATKQAKVLVNIINEKFKDVPILITGDFNTEVGDKPYKEINAFFGDSKFIAPETESSTGTFKNTNAQPDIIFINDKICAMKYDVIKDRAYQQSVTSDHYPVTLKYII